MKPTPSLLERAAQHYDFARELRGPAPVVPEPLPALEPVPVEVVELPVQPEPAPPPQPMRRALPGSRVEIDRNRLAEAGYIVPDAPVTGLAEEFRLIKRQLLAMIDGRSGASDERRRTVLVSSASPGEGKTFCAVNLALSLAGEREREVLLIDGDFPKPEALARLGVTGGPGLVDALSDPNADPEQFVLQTDVPGLSLLPAGRKAPNIPELIASERTRQVLARLTAGIGQRIILFDSPPALMASAATVLAPKVGQVLMVVRADRTNEADLREAVTLLSGSAPVSLVLNAAGFSATGRKFGSYEGYGHED